MRYALFGSLLFVGACSVVLRPGAATDGGTDGDADTYYTGCDAYVTLNGPDCNDADANNWSSCASCADGDADTHQHANADEHAGH